MSEYQAALLDFYMDCLNYEGDASLFDMSFADSEAALAPTVKVARLELACDDGSTLFFSASLGPNDSLPARQRQFLGIYDSDAMALSELIAAACHYDAYVGRLAEGHTFPLGPRSPLRAGGYAGALVLPAATYRYFKAACPVLAGVSTTVLAVLPITAAELMRRRESGLDALLGRWDADGKDLLHIRFGAPGAPGGS